MKMPMAWLKIISLKRFHDPQQNQVTWNFCLLFRSKLSVRLRWSDLKKRKKSSYFMANNDLKQTVLINRFYRGEGTVWTICWRKFEQISSRLSGQNKKIGRVDRAIANTRCRMISYTTRNRVARGDCWVLAGQIACLFRARGFSPTRKVKSWRHWSIPWKIRCGWVFEFQGLGWSDCGRSTSDPEWRIMDTLINGWNHFSGRSKTLLALNTQQNNIQAPKLLVGAEVAEKLRTENPGDPLDHVTCRRFWRRAGQWKTK